MRDAARSFVSSFDATSDRVSLVFFGNGARVIDAMPAGRGFDKAEVIADIPTTFPAEAPTWSRPLSRLGRASIGLERPAVGLRVIVLFTDGASNSVPGVYAGSGTSRGLRTFDFPDRADPDSQTQDNPTITGLYQAQSGNGVPNIPNESCTVERPHRTASDVRGSRRQASTRIIEAPGSRRRFRS